MKKEIKTVTEHYQQAGEIRSIELPVGDYEDTLPHCECRKCGEQTICDHSDKEKHEVTLCGHCSGDGRE